MGPESIVLLPGFIAAWLALTRLLEAALFSVYLLVLMLIPDYFRMPIDGFPDPGFIQTTILPIGIGICYVAVFKRRWRISGLDFFVFAFIAWQFISDDYNLGYKEAQNELFDALTLAVFPYMAGKALLELPGMRIRFARRFVFFLFLVTLISVYEFRMGDNLFRPFVSPFFPGQDPGSFTQMRWGFGRIGGPYVHAIFMCAILGIGYLLCRWLTLANQWENKFRWFGALPFKKSATIGAVLLIGMFMTLSRGPWIGVACGAMLASVGAKSDRGRALRRSLLIMAISGTVLYTAGKAYLSGVSAFEGVEEQASAEYRAVLLDEYDKIVMQSPVFGWGHVNWPKVPGMPSIDNNYMYVALGSGLVGAGLFTLLLAAGAWRSFAKGFFAKNLSRPDRTFLFTLMGIIVGIAISTATCYLAAQLYPMTFLFLGWTEACVIKRNDAVEKSVVEPVTHFRMMRAIA